MRTQVVQVAVLWISPIHAGMTTRHPDVNLLSSISGNQLQRFTLKSESLFKALGSVQYPTNALITSHLLVLYPSTIYDHLVYRHDL